ncbi:hypothetical protein EVJ58_g4464 [Rhodofomes roseus]|uniref:Uncharacterized protein n=1 Tax=Rhodofomes roseus TaxID=34475 RepID=A0A4Y9YJ94_9APHY|nr:hypothetical protein EVJ58_g4464 [Rhodofomes roseus]
MLKFVTGAVFWQAGVHGSAFCTDLWHFFIKQGTLQGIGNVFIFPLVVALHALWFLEFRTSAIEIVVGGAVATLIMDEMFALLGLRKTFAIYAVIDAACFVAALFLVNLKERRPPSKRKDITWIDNMLFKDPVFWSLGLRIFFTVLSVSLLELRFALSQD